MINQSEHINPRVVSESQVHDNSRQLLPRLHKIYQPLSSAEKHVVYGNLTILNIYKILSCNLEIWKYSVQIVLTIILTITDIMRLTHVILKPDMVLSTCTESSWTWQQFCHCTVSLLQLWMLYATRQQLHIHTCICSYNDARQNTSKWHQHYRNNTAVAGICPKERF